MELESLARAAERESNWIEAERLWKLCGRQQDANSCKLIGESVYKADQYREHVGQEPDKENPHAWVKWYDNMNTIYKEMYAQ